MNRVKWITYKIYEPCKGKIGINHHTNFTTTATSTITLSCFLLEMEERTGGQASKASRGGDLTVHSALEKLLREGEREQKKHEEGKHLVEETCRFI